MAEPAEMDDDGDGDEDDARFVGRLTGRAEGVFASLARRTRYGCPPAPARPIGRAWNASCGACASMRAPDRPTRARRCACRHRRFSTRAFNPVSSPGPRGVPCAAPPAKAPQWQGSERPRKCRQGQPGHQAVYKNRHKRREDACFYSVTARDPPDPPQPALTPSEAGAKIPVSHQHKMPAQRAWRCSCPRWRHRPEATTRSSAAGGRRPPAGGLRIPTSGRHRGPTRARRPVRRHRRFCPRAFNPVSSPGPRDGPCTAPPAEAPRLQAPERPARVPRRPAKPQNRR
jgi:hypothetical protein